MTWRMSLKAGCALLLCLSGAMLLAGPRGPRGAFETGYAELVKADLRLQPDDVRAAVRWQRESIERSGAGRRALRPGAELPAFTLADASGRAVASDQLVALGPLVVVFYRGGWDKFSRAWLRALEERAPAIEEAGAQLVAISGESVARASLLQEREDLSFALLSDPGLSVARRFGVVYRVPDAAEQVMRDHGFDLAADQGTAAPELPLPAAFVIDGGGRVVYAKVPADPYQPADPAELLAALNSLDAS